MKSLAAGLLKMSETLAGTTWLGQTAKKDNSDAASNS